MSSDLGGDWRRLGLSISFCVSLLGAGIAAAQSEPEIGTTSTQAEAAPPATSTANAPNPRIVGLTISGGISLGAYEAGFNWALIRYLRMQDDAVARLPSAVPMRLALSTGASAGNINTLLSVMEWCDAETHPAWSTRFGLWREIGLRELVPENPSDYGPNDGLLSRFVLDAKYQETAQALKALAVRQECRNHPLTLGVTLTSNEPQQRAFGGISVTSSRASVLWKTRQRGNGLELEQVYARQVADPNTLEPIAAHARYLGAIGEQLYLPTDAQNRVSAPLVMEVLKASSAVQAAFGSVSLPVCVPPRAASSGDVAPCQGVTQGVGGAASGQPYLVQYREYSDGGVFDNTPVGLALALAYELRRDSNAQPVDEIIYIDPMARRGQRSTPKPAQRNNGGLRGVADLFAGLLQSGRSYELESVRRYWGDEAQRMTASTRFHGVVGEHLGSFGAFFGKPFRDYDFHVGIADALHFIVTRVCTNPSATGSWAAKPPEETCQSDTFEALMRGLDLSAPQPIPANGQTQPDQPDQHKRLTTEALVRLLRSHEQHTTAPAYEGDVANDRRLVDVLNELVARQPSLECHASPADPTCALPWLGRIHHSIQQVEERPQAPGDDPLVAMLERDGMARILQSMTAPLDLDEGYGACGSDGFYDRDECAMMRPWATRQDIAVRAFIRKLIARQKANEPVNGMRSTLAVLEGVMRQEAIISIGTERWDGSSAGPGWAWSLIPTQVAMDLRRSGVLMSWRIEPVSGDFSYHVEATPMWLRMPARRDVDMFSALAVGLTWRASYVLLGKVDVGPVARVHWQDAGNGKAPWGAHLSVHTLFNKLRVSWMYFPWFDHEVAVMIGLSDIAGGLDVAFAD